MNGYLRHLLEGHRYWCVRYSDRAIYIVLGMMSFIVLYLWSVLDAATVHSIAMLDEPIYVYGTRFADFSLIKLEQGGIAAISQGNLHYVFSMTEEWWLALLVSVSNVLLVAVLVSGVCIAWQRSYRIYAMVLIVLSGILLISPALQWQTKGIQNPEWELLRCALVLLVMLFAKRYLTPEQDHTKAALLAYASQTGSAKQLAEQLQNAAEHLFDVRCMSELSIAQFSRYRQVFFVVSTYGNGEAPDSAQRFIKHLDKAQLDVSSSQFSVLALGDRTYQTFCAFGHSLATLLEGKGYHCSVPTQEVDRMDLSSVSGWWQQICDVLGIHSEAVSLVYDDFQVVENTCLNPGNPARPAHHIRLRCDTARYQVGDVLAVKPAAQTSSSKGLEDEHERLYSIASCDEGVVDLLVREHHRSDDSIGICSGYLCQVQPGHIVQASLRSHESFHLVGDVPLIMIGAGTGLAPFIGFLKQKHAWQSTCEHWLLFGEQYAEHDAYFAETLQHFQRQGILTQLDYAWSRSERRYVQELLAQQAEQLREWVLNKGAHIYLCGSKTGFGESLLEILQQELPSHILHQRLHKDLY